MVTATPTGRDADCPGWPPEVAERYRAAGYWRGETLSRMLTAGAAKFAERIAIVGGDQRWSYRDLDSRAQSLASGLHELGVRPGDAVVVQLPNRPVFFEVCFALFGLGARPVLALPAHRAAEITHFCTISEAVAYVVVDSDAGFDYRALAHDVRWRVPTLKHVIVAGDAQEFVPLDQLRIAPQKLPEPAASDVALFQLSGGSTGTPKLIPRTHDDYLYSVRASVDVCRLDADSVYLCALPAAHNFPLSSPGSLGTLQVGGRVVLAERPSPDVALPLIEREGVTISGVVPPLALAWLEAAAGCRYDLSSLRVLQVGGAKLASEVARRIRPTLGCTLQQVFGMAEGLVNYTRLDDPEHIVLTTQGRPMSPADEIRIVDDEDREVAPGEVGHLLTRGPYTIRGYYKSPEHNARAFTADGFYRTGDRVRLTPTGNLVVEGRAKDQINRGGEKIAAEEVEDHLLTHPGVADAALVAMPDRYLGERSCAFVIAREPALRQQELRAFLRERGLAAYKIPDRFEFVDAFPKTGIGKVSKRALRELIARKLTERTATEGAQNA